MNKRNRICENRLWVSYQLKKIHFNKSPFCFYYYITIVMLLLFPFNGNAKDWQIKKGHIMTRWAKDVTPEKVHPEYPRPQMVRKDWQNLNGLWEYAVQLKEDDAPEKFENKILVPFGIESALSGVKKRLSLKERLWYFRDFTLPLDWKGRRILLHFNAVDWHTVVSVNGKKAGEHKGGYDPFCFDITDLLSGEGKQKLLVSVWDPTTKGSQPFGKQHEPPVRWNTRYTPISGIWQTAWLEPVSDVSIKKLKIIPDIDKNEVSVEVITRGKAEGCKVKIEARDGKKSIAEKSSSITEPVLLKIRQPKLWSPDSTFLYNLKVISILSNHYSLLKVQVRDFLFEAHFVWPGPSVADTGKDFH